MKEFLIAVIVSIVIAVVTLLVYGLQTQVAPRRQLSEGASGGARPAAVHLT